MKLSQLAYRAIKDVIYFDDSGFTYSAFKQDDYRGSSDYGNQIANIFSPINECIARLSDLNKIAHRVEEITDYIDKNGIIDLTKLKYYVKEVLNVAQVVKGDYLKLDTRNFGSQKVLITSDFYYTKN